MVTRGRLALSTWHLRSSWDARIVYCQQKEGSCHWDLTCDIISFLPNQCLCEGSLYLILHPDPWKENICWHRTTTQSRLALGGAHSHSFQEAKAKPLGYLLYSAVKDGLRYRMCIKYQRYACVPATVCGPCLFQWLKLSRKWVIAIRKLPIFYNVNNTTLSLYDFHLWSWCAANMSTCHSAWGGSLGLSAVLSWEQQLINQRKEIQCFVFIGCVKNPTKGKTFSYFSKADFLYLRYWVIAEKKKKKKVRYISIPGILDVTD